MAEGEINIDNIIQRLLEGNFNRSISPIRVFNGSSQSFHGPS